MRLIYTSVALCAAVRAVPLHAAAHVIAHTHTKHTSATEELDIARKDTLDSIPALQPGAQSTPDTLNSLIGDDDEDGTISYLDTFEASESSSHNAEEHDDPAVEEILENIRDLIWNDDLQAREKLLTILDTIVHHQPGKRNEKTKDVLTQIDELVDGVLPMDEKLQAIKELVEHAREKEAAERKLKKQGGSQSVLKVEEDGKEMSQYGYLLQGSKAAEGEDTADNEVGAEDELNVGAGKDEEEEVELVVEEDPPSDGETALDDAINYIESILDSTHLTPTKKIHRILNEIVKLDLQRGSETPPEAGKDNSVETR